MQQRGFSGKFLGYLEPGRSQMEKKKNDTNSKMTKMSKLSCDFKAAIMKMPQQTIRNILEQMKSSFSQQIESFSQRTVRSSLWCRHGQVWEPHTQPVWKMAQK